MDYFMGKKEIGSRLKAIRKTKYKSQESFAEALKIADRKTISKWETGETEIPITRLSDICRLLDCDLDYIFGKIKPPKNSINNVMEETGLTEQASRILLDEEYKDILNALLIDENFIKLLDIIKEWSEADLDNTHSNLIKDNIRNKLKDKSDLSKTTIKVLSILSKDGHSAIYRPMATETANKMFDTVTSTLYEGATDNGNSK